MAKMISPSGNVVDVPGSKVDRNISRGYQEINDTHPSVKKYTPKPTQAVGNGPEQLPQEAEVANNEDE